MQDVFRCGVGRVTQLYYRTIPVGGIQVPDELRATAAAAADLQRMKDERLNTRDKERRLAMLIHTYAHTLANHFTKHAQSPFEYRRKFVLLGLEKECTNYQRTNVLQQ